MSSPQDPFARGSPKNKICVSGHGFNRIAKAGFKPIVAGDKSTVGRQVGSPAAPGLGIAGGKEFFVRVAMAKTFVMVVVAVAVVVRAIPA